MESSIQKFDVSTPAGRKQALDWVTKNGWIMFLAPVPWLAWQAGKSMMNAAKALTADAIEKETEAQRKAAVDIIIAGGKSGVDEIEIELDSRAGCRLGSDVEGFPLEVMAGASGKMKIKVKYKTNSNLNLD